MKKSFANASRRSIWRAAMAVILAIGTATALAQNTAAPAGPAVKVISAGPKSVVNFSEIDGVVEAVMQSTLSSQIPGRVLSLNVKAGDRVKAGQVLATIDDRETQTGVLRSQAQLQQSDAELRQLQIALKRTQELKTQGFVSSAALDLAEAQLQSGSSRVATVQARPVRKPK
jgi:RND family efflux transporter MFP subunit